MRTDCLPASWIHRINVNGSAYTFSNPTSIDNTSVYVSSAGSLTLPQITSYAAPSGSSGAPTLQVIDTGSVLSLPALATIGALNASGVATFTTSSLTVGSHSITTAYAATTDFAGSTSKAVSVTITAPTPAPVLAIGGPSVTFSIGGKAIAIAPAATLSTGDGLFAKSSLSVTDSASGSHDLLAIASPGTASSGLFVSDSSLVYNGVTIGGFTAPGTSLSISFNSNATQAAVLAVIRSVTYGNPISGAAPASRSITFQLTDGDGNKGAAVTQTVVLAAAPSLAIGGPAVTFTIGGKPITVAPSATLSPANGAFASSSLSVTDSASGSHDLLAIASPGTATSGLFVSGSSLVYNGVTIGGFSAPGTSLSISFNSNATQAAVLAVIRNVTYGNPIAGAALVNRTITFQLTDGDGNKDAAVSQTVVLSAPPPALAVGGPSVTFYVGGSAIVVAPLATLSTGDGAFAKASLSVTDSASGSNDRLAIASPGTATGGLFVSGSSLIYNGVTVGSFTAPGTTLSVAFNASATQAAVLAVIRNVTYGNPIAGAALVNRTITFQLTDGDGNKDAAVSQTVVLSAPPPALAIGGPSVTFYVGGPAIVVAPLATLSTGDGAFAKASLSVTDSASGSNDRLAIASPGTATSGLFVSGSSLIYNGVTVGSFTAPGTSLSVAFNASATQAAVLAVIRNVTYGNPIAGAALVNRTITFQLTDGDGNKDAPVTQTVNLTS